MACGYVDVQAESYFANCKLVKKQQNYIELENQWISKVELFYPRRAIRVLASSR